MIADKTDKGITIFSQVMGLFLAGWFACSWWYGTGSFEKAQKAIPALENEAGCEHWRAKVASKLALSPDVVAPSQIPKDCAKPTIAVTPPEHP